MWLAASYLLFFTKFLNQPKINASIMPSSPILAQAMIDGIDFSCINTIVEFGPGTGSFTKLLIQKAQPDTQIICIEYDQEYAQLLSTSYGDRIIVEHADVHDMQSILDRYQITRPDLIISGLPGNIYQDSLLQLLHQYIIDGMVFRWFSYAPHDSRTAYQWLPFVHKRFILLNLPPAFVFGSN